MGKYLFSSQKYPFTVAKPTNIAELLQQADFHLRGNRPKQALPILRNVLSVRPDIPEVHYMAGMAWLLMGRHNDAASALQKSTRLNPEFRLAWFQLGNVYNEKPDYQAAIQAWSKANKLHKDALTSFYIGKAYLQLDRPIEAEKALRTAISFEPNHSIAHDCLGISLLKQEKYAAAIAEHEQALALEKNEVEQARILTHLGLAWNDSGHPDKALEYHQNAIKLQPSYALAYNNLAASLLVLRRYEAAMAAARKATELDPKSAEAWNNLASVLSIMRLDEAALECSNKAHELKPDFEFLFGNLLYFRAKMCDWKDFNYNLAQLRRKIDQGAKVASPFSILPIIPDLTIQRKTAEIYVNTVHPELTDLGPIPKQDRRQKIRIGYYSADFHTHPVSAQIVELFELHDRSRFELFGFSFGPDDKSDLRQRISSTFDTFMDMHEKNDREVAELSREIGIDIAIDLGGFTGDPRTSIFAHRAAPIQVNYLGYPATMGAGYIDYIITDKMVIPDDKQPYYSEKVIYLPNTYMPNDTKRKISDRQFSREELGLPPTGFVFCSFNKPYKITPQIFDIWMRILRQVHGSILWLPRISSLAVSNLCKEASKRGIDPSRLVFAERMPSIEDHLARHHAADLFLDTFPYNAHSTSCDALWSGLPVLTCMGESFASRVSASLLHAVGLSDLITSTLSDYEALAISLAEDPEKLSQIRQQLGENKLTTPLFDTPLFTRHIEAAYFAIHERYRKGLPPEHISV